MLYSGLQSAVGSSGFNVSLAVSFERHTIPQAGMVSCDFNVFSVWEPGEGPPHMGRPSSMGRSKGHSKGWLWGHGHPWYRQGTAGDGAGDMPLQ